MVYEIYPRKVDPENAWKVLFWHFSGKLVWNASHTIFLFFVQLAHIHMSLVPIRIFDLMFDIKDTGFPMFLLQEISALEILVDFHLRNWIFLVRNFDQHEISLRSRFRNLKLILALRHIFRTYLYIFIKLYMMCTHQAQNIWKNFWKSHTLFFCHFSYFSDFYGKF